MNLLRKYYDKDSNGGGIPDEVRIEKAYQLLKERAKESYLSHGSFSASPFGLDGIPYVRYDAISKLMVEFSDSELSLASEEISRLKAENERLRGEGWISVEDRLPEDDEDYQVWERGAIIATAAHYRTKKYFIEHYENENYMEEGWYYSFKYPFDEKLDTDNPIEVTHWMPLIPPPPKSK